MTAARIHMRPLAWIGGARPRALTLLLVLVVCCLLFGGASRADVAPLVVLRPLAVALFLIGLLGIDREQLQKHKALLALFAASAALVALHLVPLPPQVWQALPGRGLLAEIDRSAGLEGIWRPLTLDHAGAWNALYALAVPGAVLLLAAQLKDREFIPVFAVVAFMGIIGATVSLFQVAGPPTGGLYFYRITNEGSAVGFFANRNHQALFLAALFPVLAGVAAIAPAITSKTALVRWSVLIVASILPPLILVTGSRSGLVTGGIGLVMALVIYRIGALKPIHRRTGEKPIPQWVKSGGLALGALGMLGVTIVLSRAEAIRRVLASDPTDDLRFQVLDPIVDIAQTFAPFGSGAGSFVVTYKIYEPSELIMRSYLNHAHNDWLEVLMTFGLPGAILLIWGLVWFAVRVQRSLRLLRRSPRSSATILALVAVAVIVLLMLGSLVDYPLRTPALCALLAFCAVVCDRCSGTVRPETPAAARHSPSSKA